MAAKGVENEKIPKKGKGTEKQLLYFLYTSDSNILAQTLHPQVKLETLYFVTITMICSTQALS